MTMKRSRGEEDREIETLAMANCLILLKHIAARTSNSKASSLDRVYKCKTCDRKFMSFQALGGHRASHKRPKLMSNDNIDHTHSAKIKAKTKHACSVCGLKFEMGQALGGHMRRHRADHMEKEREEAVSVPVPVPMPVLKRMKSERVNNMCLDLNLTPYENDLKFGYQIMAPLFTPLF